MDELKVIRQAVRDFEAGGLGGVGEGQRRTRVRRGGRAVDRGVREGSEEQSVQDLESDVVGELLSASGAGGGDTEAAWRRAPEFSGCPPSPTGSPRRWWPGSWRRRSSRSSIRDSYGYRPGRSALDAVGACRKRCWKSDWVIDLDIQKFFDSVPWDLIVKAVEANTDQPWVLLYVKRWLKAPMRQPDGTLLRTGPRNPTGVSGLARAGESVPALRVRRVDGPGVPGRPVRTLRR